MPERAPSRRRALVAGAAGAAGVVRLGALARVPAWGSALMAAGLSACRPGTPGASAEGGSPSASASPSETSPGTTAGSSAASATAPRGGVLRMAFADSAELLDPQASMSFVAGQLGALVYDTLTRVDRQGRPEPALATRWETADGGLTWTFHLREGVRFHHGRPFTSADVVASLERLDDPALALAGAGSLGPLISAQADGPHRVRLVYRQPFSEAPLAAAEGRAAILPADRLDRIRTEPCGTGPFRMTDFQPGSRISVRRNTQYWMPGLPLLDGVDILAIRDPVAQQGALRAGDIDLVTMISPEAYLSLRGDPRLQAWSVPQGNYHAVTLQADRFPFDRAPLREAFRYLLDREPLIASALLGQGRLGNDLPLPAGPEVATVPRHARDLARVRALLAEAALPGSLSLDLWTTSDRPPAPKLALAVSQAAAQAGITLRVRDVPYTEYVATVARRQSLYTSYHAASASLYHSVYRAYHSRGAMNYGKREAFSGADALLDELIAAPSLVERQRLTATLMPRLSLTGERLIPYFQNYLAAATRRVVGFEPPAFYAIDFRRVGLAPVAGTT